MIEDIVHYKLDHLGQWSPFHIVPYTPMIAVIIYLAVIGVLHKMMRYRKPFELSNLMGLHNLFLCLWSLVMTVGLTYRVIELVVNGGTIAAYCGTSDFKENSLLYWANMFYVSKYYELLDTVFVVLRKKGLTFLHVWHHCAVIFVCWLATRDHIVMGWITIFDNTSVHVLMYYYYAMTSFGRRDIWWRRYLTSIQIIQFCIDMVTSLPFIYFYLTGVQCKGTFESWLVANLTGFSFFLLFLNFYIQQYQNKKKVA